MCLHQATECVILRKCCYNAGNREYCKYIMTCLLRLAVLSIILILYHRRYLIPAKTSNREFLAMLVLEKLCMTQGDMRRFILRKFLISKKKKNFWKSMKELVLLMLSILICRARMTRDTVIL